MKPGSSTKYGIGFIIADCLLIVEAIINIRTGRITGSELFVIVGLSIIIGLILYGLAKKYIRGNRGVPITTKTTEQKKPENTEKESENGFLP